MWVENVPRTVGTAGFNLRLVSSLSVVAAIFDLSGGQDRLNVSKAEGMVKSQKIRKWV